VDFLPDSHAPEILAIGDGVTRVNGRPVRDVGDIGAALRGVAPGTAVAVSFVRAGRTIAQRIVTIPGPHGARLGVLVARRTNRPDLPVPVHYTIGDIAGSSGGLMFALEIYESLRPGHARDPVAGTGTIATDGRIGPIEGARQKLIAAERAGATTFLVPRQNYPDLPPADHPKIRIIPITTFTEALAAIH
jgi:PDZ domain-containing protein